MKKLVTLVISVIALINSVFALVFVATNSNNYKSSGGNIFVARTNETDIEAKNDTQTSESVSSEKTAWYSKRYEKLRYEDVKDEYKKSFLSQYADYLSHDARELAEFLDAAGALEEFGIPSSSGWELYAWSIFSKDGKTRHKALQKAREIITTEDFTDSKWEKAQEVMTICYELRSEEEYERYCSLLKL